MIGKVKRKERKDNETVHYHTALEKPQLDKVAQVINFILITSSRDCSPCADFSSLQIFLSFLLASQWKVFIIFFIFLAALFECRFTRWQQRANNDNFLFQKQNF